MPSTHCESCRFFVTYGISGECRRRAPTRHENGRAQYPDVTGGHWCGEYAAVKPIEQRRPLLGDEFDREVAAGNIRFIGEDLR